MVCYSLGWLGRETANSGWRAAKLQPHALTLTISCALLWGPYKVGSTYCYLSCSEVPMHLLDHKSTISLYHSLNPTLHSLVATIRLFQGGHWLRLGRS